MVVLGIVVIANLTPKKKRPPVSARPAEPAKIPVVNRAEEKVFSAPVEVSTSPKEYEEQIKKTQMEWGLDPFFHAVSKSEEGGSHFVLKGVSIGKQRKNYAFINNEIVKIGDSIYGYKVIEVHNNKVRLQKGEESFYLILPEK